MILFTLCGKWVLSKVIVCATESGVNITLRSRLLAADQVLRNAIFHVKNPEDSYAANLSSARNNAQVPRGQNFSLGL